MYICGPPINPRVRRRTRVLRETWRRTHPSGASGTNFGAVPGPAQFKLRTPDAVLRIRKGWMRIEADCSTDRRW
eukprot:9362905-Alexandrium_andersonii.AAC.1